MIRRACSTLVSALMLSGCSAGAAATPSTSYVPAHLQAEQPSPRRGPAADVPTESAQLASLHVRSAVTHKLLGERLRHVEAAKRAAIQEPDAGNYIGAVQVYPWAEGGLYRLYAAPEEVSDIALQPGENLVSVAAGDTARWIIGDTRSGTGATRRTHVLVKPSAAGLKTNLVIATDRRVYHLEAQSTAATAMASISWTYPDDGMLAVENERGEGPQAVAAGVAVDALNFDYRVSGDNPSWRPLRAFDDGHQVFIEFPANLGDGDAPPLFVTGEDGSTQLVNYRIRGRYYVVDHLFGAAELRMGERHQQVVRIVRDGEIARPTRSGS